MMDSKTYIDTINRKKSGKRLTNLILRKPELPIYAMVDTEVVAGDEYRSWIGEFIGVEIGRLFYGSEKVWLFSQVTSDEDEMEEFFEAEASLPYLDHAHQIIEKEAAVEFMFDWIKSLNWTTCILLHITTPDSL